MTGYDLQDVRDHIATGICPQAWALDVLDKSIANYDDLVAALEELAAVVDPIVFQRASAALAKVEAKDASVS